MDGLACLPDGAEADAGVALYFGSFNPIHIGHLALANYLCEFAGFGELWFVVSPRNPFKSDADLLPDALRLQAARLATADYPKFRVCDVEFSLPRPSYTIRTLDVLRAAHPQRRFSVIMGSDNWPSFSGWREADRILRDYAVVIYPRRGSELAAAALPPQVRLIDSAPLIEVNSTFIRRAWREGRDVPYFLHPAVQRLLKREGVIPAAHS